MPRRQRVRRDWPAIIQQHERSGLSAAAFCRRHGINLSLFYHRRRQLHSASAPEPAGFIELRPVADRRSPCAIALIHGPWRIELAPDFDAQALTRLCTCLSAAALCSP
jgi:transposase-like protein